MNAETEPAEISKSKPAAENRPSGNRTQFESTRPAESNGSRLEIDADSDRDESYDAPIEYRALCSSAVACVALGLLSALALVDLTLTPIPLVAMFLGFVAVRKIRSSPNEYTGLPLAMVGIALAAVFATTGVYRNVTAYANELPSADYMRLNYSELQPLPDEPLNSIPSDAKAFDGKKVLIKGYVYPGMQKNGIRQFLLVRDQGSCCFGGNPKITDRVQVSLSDPNGFAYSGGLFKVAGVFHVTPPTTAVDAGGAVFYHLDEAMLR